MASIPEERDFQQEPQTTVCAPAFSDFHQQMEPTSLSWRPEQASHNCLELGGPQGSPRTPFKMSEMLQFGERELGRLLETSLSWHGGGFLRAGSPVVELQC